MFNYKLKELSYIMNVQSKNNFLLFRIMVKYNVKFLFYLNLTI